MRSTALSLVATFLALAGCPESTPAPVTPVPTPPVVDPCAGAPLTDTPDACCAENPAFGDCTPPCSTDTGEAYCDCLIAAGLPYDTAECFVPEAQVLMTGYFSTPDTRFLGGTYTGGESYGVYYWEQPDEVLDEEALYDDYANLCEVTWQANSIADPGMAPCTSCEWTTRIVFSDGTDTTADNPVESVTPTVSTDLDTLNATYNCGAFAIDPFLSDGLDFGYGYGTFDMNGVDYPALYLYSDASATWSAVTTEDVSYDPITGDFTYKWVTQIGASLTPPAGP